MLNKKSIKYKKRKTKKKIIQKIIRNNKYKKMN